MKKKKKYYFSIYCYIKLGDMILIRSNFFVSVSDFTEQLSQLYDHHAESLQLLVSSYRKKNGELRKERYILM